MTFVDVKEFIKERTEALARERIATGDDGNFRHIDGNASDQGLYTYVANVANINSNCGKPIDYSLPAGHPMSFEVDEIIPVSLGDSPYSRDNVQAAHRICNRRKGNKMTHKGPSSAPLLIHVIGKNGALQAFLWLLDS